MSTSDKIRSLGQAGVPVAEIARRLKIRYQHAYNVLKSAGALSSKPKVGDRSHAPSVSKAGPQKPVLNIEQLESSGFQESAGWILTPDNELELSRPLPKDAGVYAFSSRGAVLYVGVATMGLAKRIYFYAKPSATQRTSLRVNKLIKQALGAGDSVKIHTAIPSDHQWNGLPVHGSAGLEAGLIKKYALPWNMRGVC